MRRINLTASDIQLIQRTFEMLIPLGDTFALLLYDRFFFLEPQVRPLFHTDMSLQREKLTTMLALIVRRLDQPDVFVRELKQLGLRHASYRVEPEHYQTMSEAVIWTLEECLGEKATAEMQAAWKKTLTLISETMLEGAAVSV